MALITLNISLSMIVVTTYLISYTCDEYIYIYVFILLYMQLNCKIIRMIIYISLRGKGKGKERDSREIEEMKSISLLWLISTRKGLEIRENSLVIFVLYSWYMIILIPISITLI